MFLKVAAAPGGAILAVSCGRTEGLFAFALARSSGNMRSYSHVRRSIIFHLKGDRKRALCCSSQAGQRATSLSSAERAPSPPQSTNTTVNLSSEPSGSEARVVRENEPSRDMQLMAAQAVLTKELNGGFTDVAVGGVRFSEWAVQEFPLLGGLLSGPHRKGWASYSTTIERYSNLNVNGRARLVRGAYAFLQKVAPKPAPTPPLNEHSSGQLQTSVQGGKKLEKQSARSLAPIPSWQRGTADSSLNCGGGGPSMGHQVLKPAIGKEGAPVSVSIEQDAGLASWVYGHPGSNFQLGALKQVPTRRPVQEGIKYQISIGGSATMESSFVERLAEAEDAGATSINPDLHIACAQILDPPQPSSNSVNVLRHDRDDQSSFYTQMSIRGHTIIDKGLADGGHQLTPLRHHVTAESSHIGSISDGVGIGTLSAVGPIQVSASPHLSIMVESERLAGIHGEAAAKTTVEAMASNPGGQLTDDWFAQRKWRLTASAFSNALGFWESGRIDLWEEKIGRGEGFSGNEATSWGISHEAQAVQLYSAMTKNRVEHRSFQVYREGDDAHSWLGASPDGLLERDAKGQNSTAGVLEVKCPHNKGRPEVATPYRQVPYYYMPQVQGLLEILDREWLDFYVWTMKGSVVFRVDRDRGYWKLIYGVLSEYWWSHVVPAKHALRQNNLQRVELLKPTKAHALTTVIKKESQRLSAESPAIWRETGGRFLELR